MPGPLLLVNLLISPMVNESAVPADLLRDCLASAYAGKRKKPAVMDILVTGDPEIAKLNRRHLGKDEATDVLAFDDGEMKDDRLRLGDVAVSADTARREAGGRGVPFEQELLFYALHGLLHLLGMRDDLPADRAKMHALQAKAMRDFGIEPAVGLVTRPEEGRND
ncbi:MAG: rRNA maturation RNase YbeY [Planctomycetaceae bacterium]|nr:rRNA maturation RNase YbeY [Planctomycetaceae bacterium]